MLEAALDPAAVEPATRAAAPPAPLLQARGLCFDAGGKRLVDGVDADLRPHRRAVIMGANGAGKSLLLRLLHGLIRPSAGRGAVAGAASRPRGPPRAGDGVPASGDAAAVGARQPSFRTDGARDRWIGARGPGGGGRSNGRGSAIWRSRPARVLSAGEQQRLAVARALACAPRVLFLDEPTAKPRPGVDPRGRTTGPGGARQRRHHRPGHA